MTSRPFPFDCTLCSQVKSIHFPLFSLFIPIKTILQKEGV
uniref:Uncharacterized protein n=1 Tax=Anguilla anguilla TaxID=7936 RepID=A0A0E9WNE7_ANGAN